MKKYFKTTVYVLIALCISIAYGCNNKKKPSAADVEAIEKLLNSVKEFGISLKEGEKKEEDSCSIVKSMVSLDQKLFTVKNQHARIYSTELPMINGNTNQVIIAVVFNEDDISTNVRAFLDIMDATGEDLAREHGGGQYIAIDPYCSIVMMYYGGTDEQVFNRYGIIFLKDGKQISETGNSDYKEAYVEIVKQKRKKIILTDWDYYMFRNRFPEPEESESIQCGPAILGSSTLIEVLRTDWDLIASATEINGDMDFVESLLAIPEERDAVAVVLKHAVYGIIWFDKNGKRVMAETLKKNKNTGKIDKKRRWYNGYSMPGY
jgi:hypothetical protein